jgi:putative transcriptional regulator
VGRFPGPIGRNAETAFGVTLRFSGGGARRTRHLPRSGGPAVRCKLTQAGLADLAGITRVSVNAIEGGRMVPSVLLALKLAGALGVTVDELFRIAPTENGETG